MQGLRKQLRNVLWRLDPVRLPAYKLLEPQGGRIAEYPMLNKNTTQLPWPNV